MSLTSVGSSGGTVWQVLGMLFVVILILVLAWAVTRWVASRGIGAGGVSRGGGRLAVLGQLSVGRSERLLLVRVQERCLLLGVTQYSVALLKELTEEEAREWLREPEPKATFLETLQENMRKKK